MSRLATLLRYGLPYKRFACIYIPSGITFIGWGLSVVIRRDLEANPIQYAYFVNLKTKVDELCLD